MNGFTRFVKRGASIFNLAINCRRLTAIVVAFKNSEFDLSDCYFIVSFASTSRR